MEKDDRQKKKKNKRKKNKKQKKQTKTKQRTFGFLKPIKHETPTFTFCPSSQITRETEKGQRKKEEEERKKKAKRK
jgi:hypothetical protein